MQNSSSKAFQELFGVDSTRRNQAKCVVVSSLPTMTPNAQINRNPPGGAPGPGESDGDKSDDEGGNRLPHKLQVPQIPC